MAGDLRPLEEAFNVWSTESIVFETSNRFQNPSRDAVRGLARSVSSYEDKLRSLAVEAPPIVAAYAILTLCEGGSAYARDLPPEALARKEEIRVQMGSFATVYELGDFAKELQDAARRSASPGQSLEP